MGRKSKRQIEAEEEFEKNKFTIYQAAKGDYRSADYEEDRVFAVLAVCGYPAAAAYRIAYADSRASAASSAVLASRRLREDGVQQLISNLIEMFEHGFLTINTSCRKGKRRRSWGSWYKPPKKKKRFDPI